MKYHALFIIFQKEAKFEIFVCCKLYVLVSSGVVRSKTMVLLLLFGLLFVVAPIVCKVLRLFYCPASQE